MFGFHRRKLNLGYLASRRNVRQIARKQFPLRRVAQNLHYMWIFAENGAHRFKVQSFAERFSDRVIEPKAGVYLAYLTHTEQYFGSSGNLAAKLQLHWSDLASLGGVKCILCSNPLVGFVYLNSILQINELLIATSDHFVYRSRLADVKWNHWLENCQLFLEYLRLSSKDLANGKKQLGQFTLAAQHIKFSKPSELHLDYESVERRFGAIVARIWQSWCNGFHNELVFKHQPTPFFLEDFKLSSRALDDFAALHPLPLSSLKQALTDLFFNLVQRVNRMSTTQTTYGVKAFEYQITLDSNEVFQEIVTLKFPIFERNKDSLKILEIVIDALPQKSSWIQSSRSTSWYIPILYIDELVVVPTDLQIKQAVQISLFENLDLSKSMADIRQSLAISNHSVVSLYELQPHIEPLMLPKQRMPTQPSGIHLFHQLHGRRPLAYLKKPEIQSFKRLTRSYGLHQIVYLETYKDIDYFAGHCRNGTGSVLPTLWLGGPSDQRTKPSRERDYSLLGFFDRNSDFLGGSPC